MKIIIAVVLVLFFLDGFISYCLCANSSHLSHMEEQNENLKKV